MKMTSDHMPTVALNYLNKNNGAALATVISTWGSAPRPVGSQLAISKDGAFQGSVSGGCVEGAVIIEAQAAIEDGRCRVLDFGIADEDAFSVGLACGGNIRILVEPIGVGNGFDKALVERAVEVGSLRRSFAYSVDLTTWQRKELDPLECSLGLEGNIYTQLEKPEHRLIVIGAVHIAQNLSKMAKMAGYEVFLIDPRNSFATSERFPDGQFIDAWPDKALEQIGLDAYTAVIALSHDPKIDTPALAIALRSDAFYIGALGSRNTHAKRVKELKDGGYTDAEIRKIHGPIGLNIGSKTPAEIAISIMAEMIEQLRKPETRP